MSGESGRGVGVGSESRTDRGSSPELKDLPLTGQDPFSPGVQVLGAGRTPLASVGRTEAASKCGDGRGRAVTA